MNVQEVMSAKPMSVVPATKVVDVARKMKELEVGAMPICEDGKLMGIVTDRDIVVRGLADGKDISQRAISDFMTTKPVCCQANQEIGDAVHLMEDKQIRRLPVMDTADHLVGMLTLGDVSTHVSHELSGEAVQAVSRHKGGIASTARQH